MKKLDTILENILMPIAEKLGSNKILTAIRDGIVLSMPLIIIGSMFLIFGNLPIKGYNEWLSRTGDLATWIDKIVNGSFGLIGMVAAFGVAKSLSEQHKMDGTSVGIIALSSFIIVTPSIFDTVNKGEGIPYSYLGSKGMFVALIIGIFSALIYRWFINKGIRIKMPEQVPEAVSRSFTSLIPGFAIIIFWAAIAYTLNAFNLSNIHDVILVVLGKPLSLLGNTLIGTIIAAIVNSIFWFAGLNGGQITGSVMGPLHLMNTDANRVAFQAGLEMPHIITAPFNDLFVFIGGSGATLAIILLIAFFSKSSELKSLGKLTLAPGIFNINEPAMYGIPIVLNTILIIPFILAPVVNAIISYVVMSIGLVAIPVGIAVPWTMPPIISGYLATGGQISGAVLQIILIIIDILIYLPFFKTQDRILKEKSTLE